jgi:CorA-like Mg2+ transporter protein
MRRQMNHFCVAIVLNLERLGIQLGCEKVDKGLPLALRGAQMDFLTINSRLHPLWNRVNALSAIANDLSNLRAAFKGAQNGELVLRLSLLASIVFPLTLVASMLSMGDYFTPGKKKFWIFWAGSIPAVVLFEIVLVYGTQPFRIALDLKDFIKSYRNRTKAEREKRRNAENGPEA